jgi:hypothetical protein
MDPKLVDKLYRFKDVKLERPLVTKEFYPDLEKEEAESGKKAMVKNYLVK